MKCNYHTHTFRCGHAIGSDEEYVLAAIKQGFSVLGFSDHVFVPHLEKERGMRGDYSELEEYLSSINYLKEKYKDKIKILIGFECEYFKELEDYYRDLLKSKKVDYLILGQHYLYYDKKHIFGYILSSKASLDEYVNLIEQGLKTGLFSILVHPDLYLSNYETWDEYAFTLASRICKSAKENDVILEFNQGAMRRGKRQIGDEYRYLYPNKHFWEVAKIYNNDIIMGIDAHSPNDFKHNVNLSLAPNLAKQWNLTLLKEAVLKKVE